MQKLIITLTGRSPLLMHADELANPLSPIAHAHKALTSGGKKTEATHEEIARSEWSANMYHDDDLGPYMPGQNIERCIRFGATLQKLGNKITQAFMIVEDKTPVVYEGPRTKEEMYADGRFLDYRAVVVSRARIYRARPKFNEWLVKCTGMFDDRMINREALIQAIEDAGSFFGLCDFRPRMGKFTVQVR